jgi:hypothetical protein
VAGGRLPVPASAGVRNSRSSPPISAEPTYATPGGPCAAPGNSLVVSQACGFLQPAIGGFPDEDLDVGAELEFVDASRGCVPAVPAGEELLEARGHGAVSADRAEWPQGSAGGRRRRWSAV